MNNTVSLFDALRGISSIEAAQHIGLPLKQKGTRFWACCPFHGEKTASMAVYGGDKGWYCYGCHRGGDAITLYQEYFQTDKLGAAKLLADDFGIQYDDSEPRAHSERQPTEFNLYRALENLRQKNYTKYCNVLHHADRVLDDRVKKATAYAAANGLDALDAWDMLWDSQRFVTALTARCAAEQRLDWLFAASLEKIAQMYKWEVSSNGDDNKRAGGSCTDAGGGRGS